MLEESSKTQIAEKYVEKYLEINKRTGKQFSKAFIGNVMYQENSDIFKKIPFAKDFSSSDNFSFNNTSNKIF